MTRTITTVLLRLDSTSPASGDHPAGRRGRRLVRPVVATALLVLVWVASAWWSRNRTLPHDWAHDGGSGGALVERAVLNGVELMVLGVVVWLITRRRTDVDLTQCAPSRPAAARELLVAALYAAAALVVARVLPTALGWRPFSWHLVGTLHGTHHPPTPAETVAWAGFNLVVYVMIPLGWLRRRYSWHQLALTSSNRRADLLLIGVVLAIESAVQTAALSPETWRLPPGQLIPGAALTFVLYFAGAVLPTVVFLQAVVVPRVSVVTGSRTAAMVTGSLGYALFHCWDAGLASLGLVTAAAVLVLIYALPGLFKSWLTVRTGNAWVHAWAYHALAPHVLMDTPLIVAVFQL